MRSRVVALGVVRMVAFGVVVAAGCGPSGMSDGAAGGADLRSVASDLAGGASDGPLDLASPCGTCRAPTPLCRAEDGRCVACLADADCGSATVCLSGACVPGCARGHEDCGDAGSCEADAGVCRRCMGDGDCADPTRSLCDLKSGLCQPCSPKNDRCPADRYCRDSGGAFTCEPGCKTDPECQQKLGINGRCCDHACVDIFASAAHCGACGAGCGMGHSCCGGSCHALDADPGHCGACGHACTGINSAPTCQGGACALGACLPGFGDCNGDAKDGCETVTDSDIANCGACGRACALPHASTLCAVGACTIAACDKGYRNCNGVALDGCELPVDADPKNCGACGAQCGKVPNGQSSTCRGGQCIVDSCDPGFLDCNKMGADGCETQPLSDAKHCGGCGMACPVPANASAVCAAGVCGLGKCSIGYANCDNLPANGCESFLAADDANCGACGKACGKGTRCVGGVCQILKPTWTQMFPGRSPAGRFNANMAWDASRQVAVLFGGTNWNQFEYADTWEWDGNTWTQKLPLNSPLGRDGAAMVYDEARKVVVLFGGSFGPGCAQNFRDTWEYDGVNWAQVNTRTSPDIRCYPYAAYDAKRKVTVVFGGVACQMWNDTWEYDGKDWTKVSTAQAPSPRYIGHLAFDRARNVSTLFGGWDDLQRFTDTWEYDGVNWSRPPVVGAPVGRTAGNLAYHDLLGVSVAFGGYSGLAELNDTWQFDGKNWTQQLIAAPLGRDGHAMTYDGARQQIVLFGGNNFGVVNSETWVYGP